MEKFTENGILVYGPRKAGTTLLQNLLDGSKSIMMVPDELKLKIMADNILKTKHDKKRFYFANGRSSFRNSLSVNENGGKFNIKLKDQFRLGNISDKDLDDKFDTARYIYGLNDIANDPKILNLRDIYANDILEFKKSLRDNWDYKYWASKEVGGNPDIIITHFKSVFAGSKFIFIARDPKIVVRSIILKRRSRGIILSIRSIIGEYYKTERIINYFASIKASSDKILIFYEDLVRDTHKEMKKITEFLQVPYDRIFEKPSLFGINVKVRTSSRKTKTVFREKRDWKKDLTYREKLAVILFSFFYRLFREMLGHRVVTYQKLRRIV